MMPTSVMSLRLGRLGRVGLVRLHQIIGWAGIAGVVLLAASALMVTLAWSAQKTFVQTRAARAADGVARVTLSSIAPLAPLAPVSHELPPASEIPLLLTQMEQAALANGLDWRAAEYRVIAATANQPASVEVRCSIHGAYSKLRSMLVQLKMSIPAFAIREFSASRPNADTPEIEANLALVVLLQDNGLASESFVSAPLSERAP